MTDLRQWIRDVPDFPQPGVTFRDIAPLLRDRFVAAVDAVDALLAEAEWHDCDAIAGIESRGFIFAAALAERRGLGFVPVRKQGKLPPPTVSQSYQLEYGSAALEMQAGTGRLLIVDDVFATGGTLGAAIDLSVRAGYQVNALAALIDIGIAPPTCRGLPLRRAITY